MTSGEDPEGSIFLPGSRAEELAKKFVESGEELGQMVWFERGGVPKIDRYIPDSEADANLNQRMDLYLSLEQSIKLAKAALAATNQA